VRKDRIITSALNAAVEAANESGDSRIKKLNNSDTLDLVTLIINHHTMCIRDEMLSGEDRVIIPKIGAFTKNNNKAIFNDIKKTVLNKHGYSDWIDVPKPLRPSILREINLIAKDKFQSIKRAKKVKAIDVLNENNISFKKD
jgi:hypothetical protein